MRPQTVARRLALDLIKGGWHVIITATGQFAADRVKRRLTDELSPEAANNLRVYDVDMTHLTSVRIFCEQVTAQVIRLRLLVLCPGFSYFPASAATDDGLDCSFSASYLAQFLITMSAMPDVKRSTPSLVLCLLPSSPYRDSSPAFHGVDLHMVREQIRTFEQQQGLLKVDFRYCAGLQSAFDTTTLKGTCNLVVRASVVLLREGEDDVVNDHHSFNHAHAMMGSRSSKHRHEELAVKYRSVCACMCVGL